jgi:hypothetical protein
MLPDLYPVGRPIIDGEYVKKRFILYLGYVKALTFLTGFAK